MSICQADNPTHSHTKLKHPFPYYHNQHTVMSFDQLPRDISTAIITIDPQTWRSMRLVTTYYNTTLNWLAYTNKFTVVSITTIHPSANIFLTVQTWWLDGNIHRDHDRPAIIRSDGARQWWRHNKLHREHDRPASISACGTCSWCQHGQLHREHDRPAAIYSVGTRQWWRRGRDHRVPDKHMFMYPGTLP